MSNAERTANYNLHQFTGIFPVNKTLRFELVPVGKTLEHIAKNGIIEADTELAASYKKMKKTIDEFHKAFIDDCMKDVELKSLDDFYMHYTAAAVKKAAPDYKKNFDEVKQNLRKEIAASYSNEAHKKTYDILSKDKLIQVELKKWIDANEPGLYFNEEFRNFTTYFAGYNNNRMNMYSSEEKACSVAYRLINENLPKFIDNMAVFEKLAASELAKEIPDVCKELEPYINYTSIAEMFSLPAYNATLTQAAIDAYNAVICGKSNADGIKIQGLNERINLHNQNNPGAKLPKFKPLFKQILSDRASAFWLPETFETVNEVTGAINRFYTLCDTSLFSDLKTALDGIKNAAPEKVFIRNDASISGISNAMFGYYGLIREALEYYYEQTIMPGYRDKMAAAKNDTAREKLEKAKEYFVTGKDYHTLADIEAALNAYLAVMDLDAKPEYKRDPEADCIAEWLNAECSNCIKKVMETYSLAESVLNSDHPEDYRLSQADKEQIKALLDAVLDLLHHVKPLYVKSGAELNKDTVFYGAFDPAFEELQGAAKLYDAVRNYCTKKPFSTEKIRLNFGINKGNLLGGWVDSKTDNSDNGTQYGGYLFRKLNAINEYDYYLGISANTKLFRNFTVVDSDDISGYERLDYYQPNKKTIYGAAYKGTHLYNDDKAEMLSIIRAFADKNTDTALISMIDAEKSGQNELTPIRLLSIIEKQFPEQYIKLLSDEGFQKKNKEIIDNLKATMASLYRITGAGEIMQKEYELFNDIISDISVAAKYKSFNYFAVSNNELNKALSDEKKPLYLFKISNKDLSYAETHAEGKRNSRGKENLHTMYFKALMGGNQNVYDIGDGKVFYRKKSIDGKITHPANAPVACKNPNSAGRTSTFEYDLIKDRRFSCDKYQFHLSIMANYNCDKLKKNEINENVCTYLKNNPDINIIGVDRGERHLLYISMVNRNGDVVRDKNGQLIQYSLNTITGAYKDAAGKDVQFSTPYHTLLDAKEEERKKSRENWGAIENIKELKAGYLSQVVHHISKLMVEYNAILVLEDLNSGFKNSRKKVEKQVYQNFEKAMIQKLNYLVFKDIDAEADGGIFHAYQLTDKFESFGKLIKQSGFIFYIPAWNTSKIDPVTGFTDLLKPKYKNVEDARAFFRRFERIAYNADKDYFEFAFDYDKFTDKAKDTRTKWTVCTHGKLRYAYKHSLNNNRGGVEKIDVTEEMKLLFEKNSIDIEADNLIPAITAQSGKDFFARLIKLLQVTLAMRYSCKEDGADFIMSPVMDDNGVFFNSDEAKAAGLPLPHDADANGAYNIARKGIMVLNRIDTAGKYSEWNTKISNKEWLQFVQG